MLPPVFCEAEIWLDSLIVDLGFRTSEVFEAVPRAFGC